MTISGVTPKPDWNHKPQSNGCGSLGIEVGKFSKIHAFIYAKYMKKS